MLFLGSLGFFAFCALVFEDCSNSEWHTVSSQEDAAEPSVAAEAGLHLFTAEAERSGAALAPLLAARSELEKVTEERDALRSRLSLFHLDDGINTLLYEPGDDDAAQPLYWEEQN